MIRQKIIEDRLLHDERYKELDSETVELINDISKIKVEIIGGHGNLCKAFEDYKLQGKLIGKIELIIKKCAKGKSLSQIADELESNLEEIEKFYNLVITNKNATADEIYTMSLAVN